MHESRLSAPTDTCHFYVSPVTSGALKAFFSQRNLKLSDKWLSDYFVERGGSLSLLAISEMISKLGITTVQSHGSFAKFTEFDGSTLVPLTTGQIVYCRRASLQFIILCLNQFQEETIIPSTLFKRLFVNAWLSDSFKDLVPQQNDGLLNQRLRRSWKLYNKNSPI